MLQSGERIGAEALQLVHSQHKGQSLHLAPVLGFLLRIRFLPRFYKGAASVFEILISITPVYCTADGVQELCSPIWGSRGSDASKGRARERSIRAGHIRTHDKWRVMDLAEEALLL